MIPAAGQARDRCTRGPPCQSRCSCVPCGRSNRESADEVLMWIGSAAIVQAPEADSCRACAATPDPAFSQCLASTIETRSATSTSKVVGLKPDAYVRRSDDSQADRTGRDWREHASAGLHPAGQSTAIQRLRPLSGVGLRVRLVHGAAICCTRSGEAYTRGASPIQFSWPLCSGRAGSLRRSECSAEPGTSCRA